MNHITEEEFEEWHQYILKQRNQFRRLLQDIITGVPTIGGMASTYRKLTHQEIVQMAREVLGYD